MDSKCLFIGHLEKMAVDISNGETEVFTGLKRWPRFYVLIPLSPGEEKQTCLFESAVFCVTLLKQNAKLDVLKAHISVPPSKGGTSF